MITTHVVEWTDPRVEALHTALFAEMGALYKPWLDELTPEALAAARGSLVVDPNEIAVTLLVLDDELPVATGAVRPSIPHPDTEWDVKRVYVVDEYRGRGLSKALMLDLESRAPAAGVTSIVHELSGIMHASTAEQMIAEGGVVVTEPFGEPDHVTFEWSTTFGVDGLVDLAASRSYVITETPDRRAVILDDVRALAERVAGADGRVTMPYRTEVWRYRLLP